MRRSVRFYLHHCEGRVQTAADASGIQKQAVPPPVQKGPVGVAKEKEIRVLLLRRISGGHQRLLDPQRMAVAEKDPHAADRHQPLRRFCGTEIAVAGHSIKGHVRKAAVQCLAIRPAVSQMEDHFRRSLLCGPDHVFHIAVGIGYHQNVHASVVSPLGSPTSGISSREIISSISLSLAQSSGENRSTIRSMTVSR